MSEERELPKGWVWTRIEDVAETTSGGTPSRNISQYYGGNIPWVKSGELEDNIITSTGEHITESGLENSNAKIFPQGTILVAMYGATVGKTAILGIDATTNQAICAINPLEDAFIPKYIFYWLLFQRQTLIKQSFGGAQPNINQGIIRAFPFPLAPRSEQKRIVAALEQKLTELDASVASLQQDKEKLKTARASTLKYAVEGKLTEQWRKEHPTTESASELLQSILKERRRKWEAEELAKMEVRGVVPKDNRWKTKYKEPVEPEVENLPGLLEGWCWATVEQISQIQGGIQKQPSRSPKKNAFPYLRVANVFRGRLDLSVIEKMELFGNELGTLRLEPGDLLIVEGNGSRTEIGRSALWHGEIEDCVHQNHIIRVRLKHVMPEYLDFYWNSPDGNKRVMDVAASTSGLYTLSVGKIARLPVPLPPLAEQQKIMAEVERRLSAIEQAEVAINANLKQAETARQSILEKAFAGKLVLQDPQDEPASVLLEHIREERKKREEEELQRRRESRMSTGDGTTRRRVTRRGKRALYEVVAEAQEPITPDVAFNGTGLQADVAEDVNGFFEEAYEEVDVLRRIKVLRPDTTQVLLEAVKEP